MKSSIKKIFAVVVAGVLVFALASCSVTEKVQSYFIEETSTTVPYTNKSEKPTNTKEIVEYFNKVSAQFKKSDPFQVKLRKDLETAKFNDNSDHIETENKYLKSAFKTISAFIIDNAYDGFYNDDEQEIKGTPVEIYPLEGSNVPSIVDFKQVKLATCSQKEDTTIITIEFKDDSSPLEPDGLSKVFNVTDKAAMLEEMSSVSDLLEVNDYSVAYNGGKIVCTVDRKTDNILSATYSRAIRVTADITGKGNLESLGNDTVVFELNLKEIYEVDWVDPDSTTIAEEK